MSQWLVIRCRLVLENCSGSSDSFSNPESTNPEFNLRKWVLSFSFTEQRMIINKVTTFQKLEDSGFVILSDEFVKLSLLTYFSLHEGRLFDIDDWWGDVELGNLIANGQVRKVWHASVSIKHFIWNGIRDPIATELLHHSVIITIKDLWSPEVRDWHSWLLLLLIN